MKKESLIIVDDEKSLLDMLKLSLNDAGFDCDVFTNGKDALAGLRSSAADVLITDIAMEEMHGLELTREVKRIRPDILVIVMTGFFDDFSYNQAVDAGASDFIKKPFTIEELIMRVQHVRMQDKLRTISITDELTGLLNRRGFFTMSQQQMKLAIRTKAKLVLLFADIDDFKVINDTWGHQKGDEALVTVAGILRDTFRGSDIIARMSGDEFAVLLIGTPDKNIQLINSRLQMKINQFNEQNDSFRLSLSAGMVMCEGQQQSIDDLLKEADHLMYAEKQRKKSARQQS